MIFGSFNFCSSFFIVNYVLEHLGIELTNLGLLIKDSSQKTFLNIILFEANFNKFTVLFEYFQIGSVNQNLNLGMITKNFIINFNLDLNFVH